MSKITILTPTYNRKSMLETLFESLSEQTIQNFDWLIIDDGSKDGTAEYIKQLKKKIIPFKITYIYQENGGKHRALNRGISEATGEYLYIVDSDDYLPADSIEIITKWINTIDEEPKFIGVSGLKAYPDGKPVGKTFSGEYIDCTDLERYQYNIKGDKAEVFKLDILKKYPFPEIEEEKFLTEGVVWNRIANDGYYFRQFNEVIYLCEYLAEGLTKNIDMHYVNNFEGYTLFIKELLTYSLPKPVKIKAISAYSYRAKLKQLSVRDVAQRLEIPVINIILLTAVSNVYMFVRNRK